MEKIKHVDETFLENEDVEALTVDAEKYMDQLYKKFIPYTLDAEHTALKKHIARVAADKPTDPIYLKVQFNTHSDIPEIIGSITRILESVNDVRNPVSRLADDSGKHTVRPKQFDFTKQIAQLIQGKQFTLALELIALMQEIYVQPYAKMIDIETQQPIGFDEYHLHVRKVESRNE